LDWNQIEIETIRYITSSKKPLNNKDLGLQSEQKNKIDKQIQYLRKNNVIIEKTVVKPGKGKFQKNFHPPAEDTTDFQWVRAGTLTKPSNTPCGSHQGVFTNKLTCP